MSASLPDRQAALNARAVYLVDAATGLAVAGGGGGAVAQGTLTDRSGTITAGGTSQQLVAANTARRYFMVQNPSAAPGALWVRFGATAAVAASPSIELLPGATLVFEGSFIPTTACQIIGATTGMAFTAKEA